MSHMRIFRITDDGRDHDSGDGVPTDIMHHCRFEGDTDDTMLFWRVGRSGAAMIEGQVGHHAAYGEQRAEDNDPLEEEIEWGLAAQQHVTGNSCRDMEGFDPQVHYWPASKSAARSK